MWCPTEVTTTGDYINQKWGACNMRLDDCNPQGEICLYPIITSLCIFISSQSPIFQQAALPAMMQGKRTHPATMELGSMAKITLNIRDVQILRIQAEASGAQLW